MNDRNIVATIQICIQIGENDFKQHRESRVFSTHRTIKDLLNWAESSGIKNPQMSDLQISEYTGEST
jgi:hypothetical protein